ncbi:MAG: copper homeostasis protein CutC [Bacteroidales bacterium]|nr:copper homeostasis protein CutC [Bacteroidales bacterium]
MKPFCEVCCPSLEAVARAVAAGAGRIELCERLEVGGVTPSESLIKDALAIAGAVPVNVLVRPREGDFVYSEEEAAQMLESIALCRALGASGVVIGALRSDGSVDMSLMRRLVAAARPVAARLAVAAASATAAVDPAGPGDLRPLSVTFHRAFDECSDPFAALEDIIILGIDRLLTSGHCANAWEGRFILKELVERAAGRIVIMPGCGITPANLDEIAAITAATEFHGSRIIN